MKQANAFFENIHQNRCLAVLFLIITILKVDLCCFYVPVTEFIPEEFHKGAGCIVIAVGIECFAGNLYCIVQAAVNPLVELCKICICKRN